MLKLWQQALIHPFFPAHFLQLMMMMRMLTCRILNNDNIQDEASTVVMKMFPSLNPWSIAGWDGANSPKSDPMSLR